MTSGREQGGFHARAPAAGFTGPNSAGRSYRSIEIVPVSYRKLIPWFNRGTAYLYAFIECRGAYSRRTRTGRSACNGPIGGYMCQAAR